MAKRHRRKHGSANREHLVEEVQPAGVRVVSPGAQPPSKEPRAPFKVRGLSFFDSRGQQLEKLQKLGDPLVRLRDEIDWELFRSELARVYEKERKSSAGRKPLDVVLMFKIVMLQRLYNLSDEQAEYQIRDRASFQRFLGLNVEDGSPDSTTIWLFKERLKELGLERDLFFRFELFLREKGLAAKGGQIIDATIVDVPRQRNTREENATIKDGGTPEGWEDQPPLCFSIG